jgi:PD-(D/E)XK endonuclease
LTISEETLQTELLHAGQLDRKHRGEVAELAFMRKAATLGFGVAKPWGDCDRYDVVVRADKVFWRVQIKSVWAVSPGRPHYRVKTTGNRHSPYSADQIDFLVAYVFPKDLWYVFPVAVVENRNGICVTPGSKKSTYERYREAWKLMGPANTEPAPPAAP